MKVIAYGSMLNMESLAKTIKQREFKEVIIKDHKRIFNQRAARLHLYNADPTQNKVAIANAVPEENSFFNAIIFEVDDYEFEKLRLREKNCHTKKVIAYDKEGNKVDEAVLFVGNKIYEGTEMVNNDYLPIDLYLKRCREGAYSISEEFGKKWDEITFLGDGRNIKEYLKEENLN